MQYMGPLKSIVSAKLPFMTRLPKNRGITQAEEDKSLILRQLCFLLLSTPQEGIRLRFNSIATIEARIKTKAYKIY